MKSFVDWLLEAAMDMPRALEVFGLSQPPKTGAELRTLYKKLAMSRHPDHGGSTVQMQELNAAKDFLSRHVGGTYAKGAAGRNAKAEEYGARRKAFEKTVAESIAKFFKQMDGEAYRKYFESLFKKPFKVEIVHGTASSMFTTASVPTLEMKISSEGNLDVFAVHLAGAISDAVDSLMKGTGLASQNVVFGYYVSTDALTGGKKQVITKQTYRKKADASILTDPSAVFPLARMQKIASGAVRKNSALKKRDFDAVMQNKWGCEKGNGDTWVFAFDAKPTEELHHALVVSRYTLSRKGVYQVSDYCYEKNAKSKFGYWKRMDGCVKGDCKFMPECGETMEFLESLFAYAKKNPDWKKIADFIKTGSASVVDKACA